MACCRGNRKIQPSIPNTVCQLLINRGANLPILITNGNVFMDLGSRRIMLFEAEEIYNCKGRTVQRIAALRPKLSLAQGQGFQLSTVSRKSTLLNLEQAVLLFLS